MKQLAILILGFTILGVSACRKVTNEYYTTPNQTAYETLEAGRWTSNDAGLTYSASINFLNSDVYQNDFDGVLVYISFDGDNVADIDRNWEPISQVFDGVSYSYFVSQQKLTLQIQNSDGLGTVNPPGRVRIKIVMIVSQD
ncbi:hypothetical protein BCY91_04335 [Pelobium manganitolerans]|uniref:Uncharacterized protein n=1 Tax=Pelobium manganitolerans TaxID=1842495 RepID=A0A419S5N9_9SPHI|nr:hypothetical protein [Pelobium manganitolerans]RKD16123.1 hypothetical protein BCY91_04335 [Pelobium manganitolerans]